MVTDPKDHPVHAVPEHLPRAPGDLPPSTEQRPDAPTTPGQPAPPGQSPSGPSPYSGEIENESADPVGVPPRL